MCMMCSGGYGMEGACLSSHAGGNGDCIKRKEHAASHQDASGHAWSDHDNEKIINSRKTARAYSPHRQSKADQN